MNVLIYGDSERSSALRHEVPVAIGDPFLYLETDGRRAVLTNSLEDERIARAAPELERLLDDLLGRDELAARGLRWGEIDRELCVRAVAAFGVTEATVPADFPLELADRLRREGVILRPDESLFDERRRHKTAAEMAGIRRAAEVAVAAMSEAAATLRAAEVRGDELWVDGELVTSELVRARIRELCARGGAPAPADIMVKPNGPNADGGHEPGSGPLPANVPIEIDLWPRDERSGCWADMTRTFVRGEISDEIAAIHELVLDAHERALRAVRPGIKGVELYGIACDVFEQAGHPTGRTKKHGETLRQGFFFGLGHGVGLDVHEEPAIGRTGSDPLITGDVIAIEPGTSFTAVGGTRVEDLLVVTDDGSENLTAGFHHELTP